MGGGDGEITPRIVSVESHLNVFYIYNIINKSFITTRLDMLSVYFALMYR